MEIQTSSLHSKRSAIKMRMSTIASAAFVAKRNLSAGEMTEYKLNEAKLASIDSQIAAGEAPARVFVRDNAEDRPKGYAFAAALVSLAGANLNSKAGRHMTPAHFAEKFLEDRYLAAALSAGSLAEGGGLIREGVSADFIELLRARTAVRASGVSEQPMPSGNLPIDGQSGGATASWIGEQQGTNASAPTFLRVNLSAKKLRCTVPVSNSLVRFSAKAVIDRVLQDAQSAMSSAEDVAFLRGPGTACTPCGLKGWAGHSHAAQGTPDLTKVTTDTGQAILNLLDNNSRMLKPRWIWAPRTTIYLGNLRNSNGFKVFPEIENGRFRGYPFLDTTSVPTNLGTGVDESEVYFFDAADVVIGQVPVIAARVSDVADYRDSNGALVSAFDRDETVIDIIEEVDLGVRHAGSVDVITAVLWKP
jgi:HK97 family phage major capsid protein